MKSYTIRYSDIGTFKALWPSHNLPDNLESLTVTTDSRGDVVDVEAFAFGVFPVPLNTHTFDGPALAALVQDAIEHGDIF